MCFADGKTKILSDPYLRPNRHLPKITVDDFTGADAIIITHGHIDHLSSVPEIMSADKNVKIFCTQAPAQTLVKYGVSSDRITVIAPDDEFDVGDFHFRVIASRHVTFDRGFVIRCIPRCAGMLYYGAKLGLTATHFPEAEQTVMFEITNNGKTALLSGSFSTVDGVRYPERPDVFVFPYNGSMTVDKAGVEFMKTLKPAKVFVHHHDNSFPPLTMKMDTKKLCAEINAALPATGFIEPTERKEYEI